MLEEMKSWSSIALNLIALAGVIKLWINQGEKSLEKDVTSITERISKAETKLIDHDRRIQSVVDELKHLPDKDTVTDIRLAMAELKGTVATLGESVGSISRTVHRIDDYLRNEGKG